MKGGGRKLAPFFCVSMQAALKSYLNDVPKGRNRLFYSLALMLGFVKLLKAIASAKSPAKPPPLGSRVQTYSISSQSPVR